MELAQILIKPVVTEKTSVEAESGRYTFVVNKHATKIEIKKAVEALYGVSVRQVNVRPTPKKERIVGRGRTIVKRKPVKKASVTLIAGQKMDMYKFKPEKPKK